MFAGTDGIPRTAGSLARSEPDDQTESQTDSTGTMGVGHHAEMGLVGGGLEAAFLDEIAQLHLELADVLGGRPVSGCIGIESRSAGLIEHPDGGFPVAEGNLATDQRPGESNVVHCHRDLAGRCGSRCRDIILGFFLGGFRGFLEFQTEIEDQEPGVHIGQRVVEFLFEAALDVGHRGAIGGPLVQCGNLSFG